MCPTTGEVFARPIAHRGLHAPGGPTENTVPAALAAVEAGYGIECDVQMSRDGQAVVFHDDRLERLTGSVGRVEARDAAALRALPLRGGGTIPSLAALLAAIGGRTPLVIEIKGEGALRLADAVLAAVAAYRGPVALESFDPAIVARCASAGCPVGLVGPARRGSSDPRDLPRCDFLSWDIARLDEAAAAWPALPLTSWTVRTPQQRERAARFQAQIVFEGFQP